MFTRKIKLFFFIFFILLIPNFVFADDEISDNISDSDIIEAIEASVNTSNIPDVNARHAVVIDRESKQILYGKNEKEKCKMASTTKIMTCIVILENCSLDDIVTVSNTAAGIGGSELGLSVNDKVTVLNLLYGLMLRSGNDAAMALAEYAGRQCSRFCRYDE